MGGVAYQRLVRRLGLALANAAPRLKALGNVGKQPRHELARRLLSFLSQELKAQLVVAEEGIELSAEAAETIWAEFCGWQGVGPRACAEALPHG